MREAAILGALLPRLLGCAAGPVAGCRITIRQPAPHWYLGRVRTQHPLGRRMGCRGRGCSCGQSKPYFSHSVRQAVTCWQPRVRASLGLRVRAAASDPCPGRAAAAGARRSSSRHGCLVARRALATTWSPGRRPGRWVAACQRFLAGPEQSAGRQGRRRLCAASYRLDRARMVRAPSQACGSRWGCRLGPADDGRAPQGHPLRQRPPAWPCGRWYGRSPSRCRHGRQCEPRRSESSEPWKPRSACCCRAAANSRPLILRHHCSRPDTVHGARAADRTQPGWLGYPLPAQRIAHSQAGWKSRERCGVGFSSSVAPCRGLGDH